jgi:hypothetical protein
VHGHAAKPRSHLALFSGRSYADAGPPGGIFEGVSRAYAWIDSSKAEIGDKCAWQFGAPVTLGHTQWQLQEEWSNAISGCAQGS